MKRIPLTQGKFAIVDDEDYGYVNQWKWCARKSPKNKSFYALRNSDYVKGSGRGAKRNIVFMHRQLMETPKGLVTDHINGDGLDNRRANLRVCTHAVNGQNRNFLNSTNRSGTNGVSWDNERKKWLVSVCRNSRFTKLGRFADKEDAVAMMEAFTIAEKLNPNGLPL